MSRTLLEVRETLVNKTAVAPAFMRRWANFQHRIWYNNNNNILYVILYRIYINIICYIVLHIIIIYNNSFHPFFREKKLISLAPCLAYDLVLGPLQIILSDPDPPRDHPFLI